MKKIIASILALALACMSMSAANPEIKSLGESKYLITVGEVAMTVDAGQGAKVLSFKYNGEEVMSQMTRPNSFGSTFWTSPQKDWNWPPVPEYDRLPYTEELNGNTLVLTSQLSKRFPYRIRKTFTPDAKDNSIVITYTIINESDAEHTVAPWEITRVPGDGLIFCAAPLDKITPANTPDLLEFKSAYGLSWYEYDTFEKNRKMNVDGKGWLAYSNNGLLLVKRFDDLKEGQPAPDEAEIQIYVDAGKTFIEIESQGAYQTLKAGESLDWTVRWNLLPQKLANTPSKKLAKAAKKICK